MFLREKPEWFLKLTPIGKVPIVQVGDSLHFESLITRQDIDFFFYHSWGSTASLLKLVVYSEYLDDRFPEVPLRGATPEARATDKQMVEISKRVSQWRKCLSL